jgi:tripartite ATP-independent transporter DctM subunit
LAAAEYCCFWFVIFSERGSPSARVELRQQVGPGPDASRPPLSRKEKLTVTNLVFQLAVIFIALVVCEVPVAYSMLLTALAYFYLLQPGIPPTIIPQQVIGLPMESFELLAVPLFLLAGNLLNLSGMTARLVAFAVAIIGFVRGGMGHAVVIANLIMSGMSGSATADAVGIGSMMIPALRRAGLAPGPSAALCATAATLGPIVPPSITMAIYSSFSNVSLGRLLLGGILPGCAMAIFLMINFFFSPESVQVARQSFDLCKIAKGTRDAILALLMPMIILGGMFGGVYTPTEGSAIAVAYAMFVGLVVFRSLTIKLIYSALVDSAVTSGIVLSVVAAASAIRWILTAEQAGDTLKRIFVPFNTSPSLSLVVIVFMTVAMGMIMEDTSILVLMTPVLAPIAVSLGIDPVHFGVTFVLAIMIGLVHPPAGILMYVTSTLAGITIWEFMRAAWRPIIAMLLCAIVVALFPQLVLYIPNAVMPER